MTEAAEKEVAEVQAPEIKAPEPDKAKTGGTEDPKWLADRLDRERRAVLKQLGVEDVDDAKKAISELKKIRQDQMSETERLRAQIAELEKTNISMSTYKEAVGSLASVSLQTLTDEQREVVLSLAGDDPALQIRTIEKLKPTWKSGAPASAAPIQTSPTASSPKPSVTVEPAKREVWKQVQAKNPFEAAEYLLANVQEITQK